MSIKLKCNCGAGLSVGDEFAGKKVKCPKCKTILNVPAVGVPGVVEASSTPQTPPPPQAVQPPAPVAEVVSQSPPPTPPVPVPAEPAAPAPAEPAAKKSSISSRSGRSSSDKKEKTSGRGEGRSGRSEGPEKSERSERSGRSRNEAPSKTKLYVILGSTGVCVLLIVVLLVMRSGKPSSSVDSDIQTVIDAFYRAGSAEKAQQYVTYEINSFQYQRQSKKATVSRYMSQTSKGDLTIIRAKLKIPGNSAQEVEIAMKKVNGVWKIEYFG